MEEHSWRYQGDKFKWGILVELGIWTQIVWQVKWQVHKCWQCAAFQQNPACLRAIHMLQHMSVRRGVHNHNLCKWEVSQALKIAARIPVCCINWCLSTCIPSNKQLPSAQREICNITSCLLVQKLDLTGQDLLGKKGLLWALSSEPIESLCINHKQAAIAETLLYRRAVLTSTQK